MSSFWQKVQLFLFCPDLWLLAEALCCLIGAWLDQIYTINCCYNQLQSTRDTVPYFGLNGQSMILCFWPPLHPLSKLLAIQGHAQTLEEQLWMGGREVSIISHGSVTSSDLKHKRLFFRESVSTFLQLVVAYNPWAKTSS